MYSFIISIVVLILGFFTYGKIVDRNFNPDSRTTPANRKNDGVDYIPMPTWKVLLIQTLNIAGIGPIFGALGGALYGPVVYIWIVAGCIFIGAVHDYNCGMLSMRNGGVSIPELVGKYMGKHFGSITRIFSVLLLVVCGVVFTTGPVELLKEITPDWISDNIVILIIIAYYFLVTIVPLNKVIGYIYPIFGVCIFVMILGISGSMLFSGKFTMPELWNNLENKHAVGGNVWPFMLVTVSCGVISGFHSTQAPVMARCCKSEKDGLKIFYGATVLVGIISLVWAAAGVTVYDDSRALFDAGGGCSEVVYEICVSTMGKAGSIIALIGVIVCPISSGDTAYRSARLILADWFNVEQKDIKNRIFLTIPLLIAGFLICQIDYSFVWTHFSWLNQIFAVIFLWCISNYYKIKGKNYIITLIPAIFMTAMTVSYFIAAPEYLGTRWFYLGVSYNIYYKIGNIAGIVVAAVATIIFLVRNARLK